MRVFTAAAIIMNEVRDRSARACLNAPMPPEPPKGHQQFRFQVGDTATTSGAGPIIAGLAVEIVERYKQHGFCYYRDNHNRVHRDKDLV